METSPCCNSVAGHQIATNVCTCHDSTAVVPCTTFCSDHCIRIEMRVKRNFHRIWIVMEKPLVKRGPGYFHSSLLKMKIFVLDKLILSPLVWQVGLVQGGGGGCKSDYWEQIVWLSGVANVRGPLTRYVKMRVAHAPGMSGTFSPIPRVCDPDMYHDTVYGTNFFPLWAIELFLMPAVGVIVIEDTLANVNPHH